MNNEDYLLFELDSRCSNQIGCGERKTGDIAISRNKLPFSLTSRLCDFIATSRGQLPKAYKESNIKKRETHVYNELLSIELFSFQISRYLNKIWQGNAYTYVT